VLIALLEERGMRCIVAVAVLMVSVTGVSANRLVADRQSAGDDLLEQTRNALGGVALAAVRTMRAEGQSTRVVGPLRLSSAIELLLERPDRFLRIDRMRLGGSSAETAAGFVGDQFFQRTPQPLASSLGSDQSPERSQALMRAAAVGLRKELTLLLVGFFGDTFDGSTLQVARIGLAEAPDGKAEAFRLTFGDGSIATLFVHVETHLPLIVSWQGSDPAVAVRLATSPETAVASALAASAEIPLVEHRLHFNDYRQIGGLRWPFLIRRTGGGTPMEELRIERFTLNPVFKARTFTDER
jgi:hypothetical protein